jgi:hypothetical protein
MRRISTASTWLADPRVLITIAALVAALFYLLVSTWIFRVGFPLDDTWIHLNYGRFYSGLGFFSILRRMLGLIFSVGFY